MNIKVSLVPVSLLLAVATLAQPAMAQEPESKPIPHAVVQIDDEYRVVKADEVAGLKAELKQEHKDAVEAHKAEVKARKARKEKGTLPAPKAKKLKVVKASIDEAAANKLVEQLREKAQKKGQKKQPRQPKERPAKKGSSKPERAKKPAKKSGSEREKK